MNEHKQDGTNLERDKSAFEIGGKPGEGGQSDIQDELRDKNELQEEFTGMAQTGEQDFARDGQGAKDPK
jgi:hypothetical protein